VRAVANSSQLLKIVNIIAYAITIVVNGIAGGTTILGGLNTAQISNANPTLITPAGYVFSIWGVIYILLGAFVIFQVLPRNKDKNFQSEVSWLFVLSCIFNTTWIFLWQYKYFALSVLFIFLLLASLIAIYLRLNIGRSAAPLSEKLAVRLPFSVYLGWITIASIADVAVALVSAKWDGAGIAAGTWAVLVVAIALLISVVVIATRRDIGYSLVIIWALLGISVNQTGNQLVVMTTEIAAIVVTIFIVAAVSITRFWHKPSTPPQKKARDANFGYGKMDAAGCE